MHRVVGKAIQSIHDGDKSLDEFRGLEPHEVQKAIYPDELRRNKRIPLPDYASIHRRIADSNGKWNLMSEWFDYIKSNPDGYRLLSRSQQLAGLEEDGNDN